MKSRHNIEVKYTVDRGDLAARGRIGGLVSYALHGDQTGSARATYTKSWLQGHGCRVCGDYVALPPDLSLSERARRAEALRRAHFARLARASREARKVGRRRAA